MAHKFKLGAEELGKLSARMHIDNADLDEIFNLTDGYIAGLKLMQKIGPAAWDALMAGDAMVIANNVEPTYTKPLVGDSENVWILDGHYRRLDKPTTQETK